MSDTETKTREQELLEEFQQGLDDDGAAALAKRVADLEADRDRSSDVAAVLQKERDDAVARAEKAEKALKSVTAKVMRAPSPAKPRKVGAMKDGEAVTDAGFDDDGKPLRALSDALDVAAREGKSIEIVFSDGKQELIQVAPIAVEGPAWIDRMQGKFLLEPIELAGGGPASFQVTGYGLLIDGKQVAYTERSDPLNVAPGTRITLADDIYFK